MSAYVLFGILDHSLIIRRDQGHIHPDSTAASIIYLQLQFIGLCIIFFICLEWLLLGMMVSFQAAHEEILIQLENYRALELRTVRIFKVCSLILALSLDVGLLIIIFSDTAEQRNKYSRNCKIITTFGLMMITSAIFGYLWYSLSTKMYLSYEKHRAKLFTSYFAVNLLMLCELLDSVLQDSSTAVAQDITYLISTLSVLVFLMAREPHDCFSCYNRVVEVRYSDYAGEIQSIQRGKADFNSMIY